MAAGDIFETLFETILKDITKAQNASNIFSAILAEKYADPAKYNLPDALRYFPLTKPYYQLL